MMALLYLLPAVNGLLEPQQLHDQGVSVQTQGLWVAGDVLRRAILPRPLNIQIQNVKCVQHKTEKQTMSRTPTFL